MQFDENKLQKFGIIDGFTLKLLAMLTMLTDHIGAILFPQYLVLRIIGRLAFPIYCFLLAEGAIYTKNIGKYSARLLLFAVLSEIPFDLAFSGRLFDWGSQNVFFTLFFGLLGIRIIQKSETYWWLGLLCMIPAELLHTDYGAIGVLFVFTFYLLYERRYYKLLAFSLINLVGYAGTPQAYASLAALPMALYNGKRGFRVKYFFYLFYPLHLMVLYFISR